MLMHLNFKFIINIGNLTTGAKLSIDIFIEEVGGARDLKC